MAVTTDGSVTIECLADTSKFDLQLQKLERRIDQAEKNKQLKFSASQSAVRELENYKQKIFEVEQEFEKLSIEKEKNDAILAKQAQGTFLTPAEYTQIEKYQQIEKSYNQIGNQLDKMYIKQDTLTNKVERTANAYEVADNKVKDLRTDLELLNRKKLDDEVKNVNSGLRTSNFHLDSILKKTARWILALFSVRSIMSMISRASSIVAQYDAQYASDLQYIQYALAMAIKPILEWIVKAIYTILGLVNSVYKFFTGKDLFKTADAFVSAKNSLASGAKSAKEIKENLTSAGFDELNTLQDNSTASSAGGVGGGIASPTQDLTKSFNVDWMQKIKEFGGWVINNWPKVLLTLLGIGAFILLIKKLRKPVEGVTVGFRDLLKTLGKAVLIFAVLRRRSISN